MSSKSRMQYSKNSGLEPSKEKLYCAAYSICELVRPGQINRPLPYNGVVEAFHKFRQMDNWKIVRNFTPLLSLHENLSQQPNRGFLVPPYIRAAHRVHRARKHTCLPQAAVCPCFLCHADIQPPQAFRRACIAGQLRAKPVSYAGKSAFSDLAQNRVLAGKIAEECRLADLENLYDVIDPCVFKAALAKQFDRSIDDLLT